MRPAKRLTLAAPPPDPFGERRRARLRVRVPLLGGSFEFETDSARLLRLVQLAYAQLPAQRWARVPPRFRIRLQLTPRPPSRRGAAREPPPPVRPLAGPGVLCGAVEGASFASIAPQQRAALLVVSPELLRHAYHIRYELLEFAVYVLAARAQRLVPLHAACVGRGRQGVLVIGASGAGKSTLVLHCLLGGLELLAEDSVLVKPAGLLATGVANYLHLRRDALRFLAPAERRRIARRSSLIRRRSGVEKLEIDVRGGRAAAGSLARRPLRLRAVLFLSAARAGPGALLTPLPRALALKRLAASQRYAATQPGWRAFRAQLAALPAFELRRGEHPRAAAAAVRELLEPPRRGARARPLQRFRITMRK
jgi:hypothetical protein